MVKLNSNSVAVDVLSDVKKVEKILKINEWWFNFSFRLETKPSLPDILVKKVYSANAACEKADEDLKKFQNVSHVSVVGVKQLLYEESVYKCILKSKIDKLVTRGIANLDRFHFAYETIKLSNNLQLKIQSRFFNHGYLDLLIAKSKYEENLLNKFKHILNCVRFNLFTGCSTGFFAIIYALHENLNSKIFNIWRWNENRITFL